MYRAYAQDPQARVNVGIRRRLAPLLGNDRKLIEMMNGLLLSMPGTPIVYYGDEIGMGDNIYLGDRNAVRTPMQWNGDRNAGFSDGQPPAAVPAGHHRPRVPLAGGQRRGAGPEPQLAAVVDEAADRAAPALQGVRARHARDAASRRTARSSPSSASTRTSASCASSTCRATSSASSSTCRRCAAPSRSSFRQRRNSRPSVTCPTSSRSAPTGSTGSRSSASRRSPTQERPRFSTRGRWDAVFDGPNRRRLESWLRPTWPSAGGSPRRRGRITSATILDTVPIPACPPAGTARRTGVPVAHLLIVQVELDFGAPERYLVPVAFLEGREAEDMRKYHPDAVVADLRTATRRRRPGRRGALARLRHGHDRRSGPAAGRWRAPRPARPGSRRPACASSTAASGPTAPPIRSRASSRTPRSCWTSRPS